MIRVTTVALALAALASLPVEVAAQGASLKVPSSLSEQAPATYKVKFDTSIGVVVGGAMSGARGNSNSIDVPSPGAEVTPR